MNGTEAKPSGPLAEKPGEWQPKTGVPDETKEFVDGIRSPKGEAATDLHPLIGWAVKGSAGALAILNRLIRAQGKSLSSEWYDEIKRLHEELGAILEETKRGKRG